MSPWPIIPFIRRRPERERQQIPLPPPPSQYEIDLHRTGSNNRHDEKKPQRGVVIIDM